MTTSEILNLSRAKILEESEAIIDDATLLIYANLANQDVYKKTFPASQIVSATLSLSGGSVTLPTNFGTLYGDPMDSARQAYPELSIDDFNKRTLPLSTTVEGGSLKVYPTTVTSLSVKYWPSYPSITAVVNPTIDSYFHECIVYGIVYRAYEDLQDEPLSQYYKNKYDLMIVEKTAAQSTYEETNQRAGQMFEQQDLIGGNSMGNPDFF